VKHDKEVKNSVVAPPPGLRQYAQHTGRLGGLKAAAQLTARQRTARARKAGIASGRARAKGGTQ
jgi:hypothetical protein